MAGMTKWSSVLLRGILAIIFGIIILVWPGATTLVLIIAFGVFALVEGLFSIGMSIGRGASHEKFFGLLMLGVVSLLIGIIALARPGATTLVILYVIAFWFVIRGFLLIVSAFEMEGSAGAKWLFGIIGFLSIVIGIVFFASPVTGVFTVILVLALYSLFAGILLTILSFMLRSEEKKMAAA